MQQDWILGLIGGLLIGSAAALFLLVNGRIMGASGIVGALVDGTAQDSKGEKLAFLAGLIAVPAMLRPFWGEVSVHLTPNLGVLILGGALVGLGTRLANGCTSGHGVCGLSRFSPRSVLSTLLYLAAGAITMALARHVWGLI